MYKKTSSNASLCQLLRSKSISITRKTILLMVLFIGVFSFPAFSNALETKVIINIKNKPLSEVFEAIKTQTSYSFWFDVNDVDVNQLVSISVKNKSVQEVLETVLAGKNLDFKLNGQHIVISKQLAANRVSAIVTSSKSSEVSGVVKNALGETIPGASVLIKGTQVGVMTDLEGRFSIKAKPEDVLQISYLGLVTQELPVGPRTDFNLTLLEDASKLDEVVVVGYGTMKKKDLTGAVTSVRQKDLPQAANTSIAHMLSGRAPGLTITQTSAQPGGGLSIQIRGKSANKSPLIVIDGFAQTGYDAPGGGYISGSQGSTESSLNSINPNDIESIEVLKDASATSIYGARAAGGVILITTKRGKEGQVRINYKGSVSVQQTYGLPTMLNPRDFMTETNEVIKETWMRNNLVYPYGIKTLAQAQQEATAAGKPLWINKYTNDQISNPPAGTDWLDEVMQAGSIQEHNLSMQGGTEKTKYLASASYYDQTGIVKNSDMKRFTARVNLDQKITNWLSTGFTSNVSQIKSNNAGLGSGAFENSSIIRSAIQFNPLIAVRDENGVFNLDSGQGFLPNPVSLLDITDQTTTERLMMTGFVLIEPMAGFTIKGLLGVDRNQGNRNFYMPKTVLAGNREGGYASKYSNSKTDYTMNVVANYLKTIDIHSIGVTLGHEYQKFTNDETGALNSLFPYDGMLWHNLGSGTRPRPGVMSSGGTGKIASYIARVNYVLADKYLLTANLRADGSSNFTKKHKWGYFPGVSLGWKMHEELFMASTKNWLSELKLRVGYGQTGNDNISIEGIESIYTTYSSGWNYLFDNKLSTGIGLSSLENPDLKWETQTDLNLGLDFALFNQKVSGSIEVFDRKVKNIIGAKSLMSYHEQNKIAANLDAIKQSRGFEFYFKTRNISKPDFTWTSDFSLTYYRDQWKKRDPSWKPDINNDKYAYFDEQWYFEADGLVRPDDTEYITKYNAIPGTIKIKDVNGYAKNPDGSNVLDTDGRPQYSGGPDDKIDNADKIKIGINTPISFGLANSVTYKGFDLNVFFYAMANRWKVNSTKEFYFGESFRLKDGANMMEEVRDRWSYRNMNSDQPSIFQVNAKHGSGDFYLEKAWFIRCKNITLGYSLPQSLVGKVFNSTRFFVDAQNIFVITPYSGSDPETDAMAAYPNQRTFTFGVELTF